MDISIIIPTTVSRQEIFAETLAKAAEALVNIKGEILVINDSAGSKLVLPQAYANVSVLNNPSRGVAAARNFGAQNASGEILLFLDNDIITSADTLTHILTLHRQLPNACINPDWIYPDKLFAEINKTNFGKFISRHNMISYRGWYGDEGWVVNQLFASRSVASFHLSISKENFKKCCGYNDTYGHAEDYDFPIRLKNAGIVCYIDSRIVVFHNEADKALNPLARLQTLEARSGLRKTAVSLGFQELSLTYSAGKARLLKILLFFSSPLIKLLNLLPNNEPFYKLYARIYTVLEAVYIYKGYVD